MTKFPAFLLFSIFALGACSGPAPHTEKPNFIFILVDDLGWKDLGCYGSEFHETPNIDRLAGEGVRFTNAYAACPVCSPTRASIVTGKYPARLGITDWIPGRQAYAGPQPCDRLLPRDFTLNLALEEVTLAETLGEAGYRTFFAGKWHMGQDSAYWPEHQGFEINKGGWSAGWPHGGYFSPYENPRLESGPKGENLTDRLTDESIRFMEEHGQEHGEEPFFLYLSFYAVHNPMQAKEELILKYENKLDETGLEKDQMLSSDREWIRHAPPRGNYVERIRQGHPTYAGMIETLDLNIGRLMQSLEELGLADNTVLFFMSDNGGLSTSEGSPTSNLPLRAGKGWLYEGGIREPMIIRWPDALRAGLESAGGKPAGSVCDVPVTSTDFYPTILEMAGLEPMPGQHMDGVSLVPLLTGKNEPAGENNTAGTNDSSAEKSRPLYWHYPHYSNQGGKPGAAVRFRDYKLIEFFEDTTVELYDLSADPGEQNDLSEELPGRKEELLDLLHAWQEETNAEGMDPNPDYDPDYLREKYLNQFP